MSHYWFLSSQLILVHISKINTGVVVFSYLLFPTYAVRLFTNYWYMYV